MSKKLNIENITSANIPNEEEAELTICSVTCLDENGKPFGNHKLFGEIAEIGERAITQVTEMKGANDHVSFEIMLEGIPTPIVTASFNEGKGLTQTAQINFYRSCM